MNPKEIIQKFDIFLSQQALTLDAVVIGGAALGLLGVVSRQTRDCDILHPKIPPAILAAAKNFAEISRSEGTFLADEWLNNGPESLTNMLTEGWMNRLQVIFDGQALTLRCLGRLDLLRSKLFALCDRGIDLGDCLALAPARSELNEIITWLEQQDANPNWPAHVHATLDDLRRRLGHGI